MAMAEFDYGSFDFGSPDPSAYSGGSDILGSQGMYGGGADLATGFQANPAAAYDPSQGPAQQQVGNWFSNLFGGGSAAPGVGAGGGGAMGQLGSLQGMLGLGGAGAGLLGALMSGGVRGTTTPQIPTAARAQIGQANQALQPAAMGQLPLQQQQAG